jgi:ADP-ribose pyrophosphatase
MTQDGAEIVDSRVVYRSSVFDVAEQRFRFADGVEHARSVVQHPGAVAIVALDDAGRWLLIEQFRLPAGAVLLEIPAGTLEPGEAPELTAQRELREETGFAAASIERLGGTWMAPGFCTEFIHYFVARGLRADPLPHDADERISAPLAYTFDEVLAAIDAGRICDAKSVAAALLYERWMRGRGGDASRA